MTNASFESVWTKTADGLRLHARLYGALPAAGDRLPVVCLPGLARNAGDFHALAEALRAEEPDRTVLAVDYRGRGRSDHSPDPAHYTVPVETGDLFGLLGEIGLARAAFVGTSRGGLITMAAAAARPGLVAGAVLNDIGPVLDLAGLLRIKSYVGRLDTPDDLDRAGAAVQALFGAQFPNLTTDEWRGWAASTWAEREGRLQIDYDPALARTLDAIVPDAELPDLWPLFRALDGVPVLVVRGALSDLLSAETLARMAVEHTGLDSLTVPDEGHTPFLHRPTVLAAVRRLLGRADAAIPPAALPPAVSAPIG